MQGQPGRFSNGMTGNSLYTGDRFPDQQFKPPQHPSAEQRRSLSRSAVQNHPNIPQLNTGDRFPDQQFKPPQHPSAEQPRHMKQEPPNDYCGA
jgi:hypothetical protein